MAPPPAALQLSIIGGGIGGLSCALSLLHHNPALSITIYEQASAYTEIGAGVGIGVNAARILHAIGVGPAANAISGTRNRIHRTLRRWDDGGEIVTVSADFDEGEIRQLSVHRAELLEVLLEGVRATGRVELYTGKKCVRVEDAGSQTTIHFADGTSASTDLLVACDGIHSTIRAQLANDGPPQYSGRVAYRGLIPLSAAAPFWKLSSYAASWLGKDKHFLVFPVSQDKVLNIVGFVTVPEEELGGVEESWTSSAPRAELEREFAGWDEAVVKVIACMDERPAKWRLNDREPLEKWSFMGGKVVLLGDAAHAMLPHQGSGAGHAIEDGYILGRAVKDYLTDAQERSLETWMGVYEAVRLPRTKRAQITSRQAGEVYEMQGEAFAGLTYDEGLPIVKSKLEHRMKWVWGGDIDAEYEKLVTERGMRVDGAGGVGGSA